MTTPGNKQAHEKRMAELAAKRRKRDERLAAMARQAHQEELAALATNPLGRCLLGSLADLEELPTEEWAPYVARQDWLFHPAVPNAFRTNAKVEISRRLAERIRAEGGDPLNDPMPDEPDGPFQSIAQVFNRAMPATPAPTTKTERTKPMISITLNISSPADIEAARAMLPGILGGFAATHAPEATASVPLAPDVQPEPAKKTRARKAAEPAPEPTVDADFAPLPDKDIAAEAPVEAQPEPVAEAPAAIDGPAVVAALQAFAKVKGPLAVKALLTKFNASRLSDIKPDQYAAVMAEVA
ncbi:hypothetical protein [Paramagnetospirillum magneticum]|uniref:Uncharacterized protein n=1 Tax=Paramagnetospirillum magneticum (strain ATCC 700264 / AMB-1) TaxID=342108 RepID=Q2W5Y6_PARM1|nr:hypothetical protein [Paramagnetospirillum magneticum]BAE50739.1 hypothetical protein amb1935 [Paramagnetospirillum magneticum AMB-1]